MRHYHLFSLITLWEPIYGLEAVVKLITAAVSSAAAVVATWFVIPRALRLPSPAMLHEANLQLIEEVDSHSRTNRDLIRVQDQLRAHMSVRAQEMETKAEELERANESPRRFAHIASHDLQEPLRKISVYTDLLEQADGPQRHRGSPPHGKPVAQDVGTGAHDGHGSAALFQDEPVRPLAPPPPDQYRRCNP
ncbi:hypothetical protein [Breoghania sp.]|uniref:hypothetical protein n=1 Tax=Breoghania sp. TaxID=2065378 RepID=UPI00261B5E5E|nr:hypothetical protein [Breoghania sp.]MDJ0930237.1 hypothetical protein [Breoghania sp.]